MSKDMTEFICDACSRARDNQEIFCLCKQPYDETQFYIGCEGCPDWYHGRCVGILQSEAGQIDEYFCPRCSPNSVLNRPNLKLLNAQDYDLIKKLVKQLLVRIKCIGKKEGRIIGYAKRLFRKRL